MFWGLIIEPGKKYSQTVEDSFHVSKAALDLAKASDEETTLVLDYEGQQEYILCHLNKTNKQESLDLNFQAGDTISLFTQGQSSIHLSGYLLGDDDDEDMTLGEMMEEEEEEEEEEEAAAEVMEEVAKVAKKPLNNNGTAQKRKKVEVEEEEAEDEDGEEEEEPVKPQKQKKQEQKQKGKPQGQQQQPKQQQQQQQQNKAKQGGDKQQGQAVGNGQADAKEGPKKEQAKRTLQGGLVVEEVKPGSGQGAKKGDKVSVYYVGRLQNNKKFDSSTQGPGFKFRLGAGEVIKGWDIGLVGMKVGGKRKLTIPAKLAYGAGGSPPAIPPNATLVFDVELKSLN